MPAALPPDKRQAVLHAIRAGGTCRGIARDHHVSTATVRNIAADNGIENAFARDQTKKATEARVADHAAKLAQLAGRNAQVAEAILDSFDTMTVDEWRNVTPHSRGIVLGIVQDKARDLAPPGEQTQAAKTAIAGIVEAIRDGWERDTE